MSGPDNATWLTPGILVVPGLYSGDECAALIQEAETVHGFQPASVRTASGAKMLPLIRNNDRVTYTCAKTSEEMWRRIRPFLPSTEDSAPVGVDSSIRIYKYSGRQRFQRHKDGSVTRSDGAMSKLSYLVYLNDDFEGGDTIFTFPKTAQSIRDGDNLTVTPQRGMALLFVHDQWHEGRPVSTGTKYVLRSDVFFSAVP